MTVEVTAPKMKYFTPASALSLLLRMKPASIYSEKLAVSVARYSMIKSFAPAIRHMASVAKITIEKYSPPARNGRKSIETKQVSDATFAAAKNLLGERGVVELVNVMGWYGLVSMYLNVDRYPLPEGVVAELKPLK